MLSGTILSSTAASMNPAPIAIRYLKVVWPTRRTDISNPPSRLAAAAITPYRIMKRVPRPISVVEKPTNFLLYHGIIRSRQRNERQQSHNRTRSRDRSLQERCRHHPDSRKP